MGWTPEEDYKALNLFIEKHCIHSTVIMEERKQGRKFDVPNSKINLGSLFSNYILFAFSVKLNSSLKVRFDIY